MPAYKDGLWISYITGRAAKRSELPNAMAISDEKPLKGEKMNSLLMAMRQLFPSTSEVASIVHKLQDLPDSSITDGKQTLDLTRMVTQRK